MDQPLPADLAMPEPPIDGDALSEYLDTSGVVGELSDEQIDKLAPELAAVFRWRVEDDEDAEWAMRMLVGYATELDGIEIQHRAWVAQIERSLAEARKRIKPRFAFFHGHLEQYALRVRRAEPDKKAVHLPSGRVSTRRATAPAVEIADEAAVLAWLAENLTEQTYEKVVKTVEEVRILELRKLVTVKDGKVVRLVGEEAQEVPGCSIREPETTATVSPTVPQLTR